jgi:DNA-binding transcriptional LysR family regulator
MTQQALSGQIRQLEERVGSKLVDRVTRRVELTPAGAALFAQARPLLADAQQAIAAARAASQRAPQLTVGYIAALTRRLFADTIRAFTERHPEVELTLHFGEFLDPWGGLRDGEADVAILYGEFDQTGLELHYLFSKPRGCAMAADHPLAARQELTIDEFTAEPLVDVPMLDPICWAFWRADRLRHGAPARIGATVRTLDGLIEAVGAGLGVTGTIELAVDALGPSAGVIFRPVPDLGPLDFFAAHRSGEKRPQVLDFIDTVIKTQATLDAVSAPAYGD